MAVAHPPEVIIEIGGHRLTLKPWTMAQRVKIRPVLAQLLGHLSTLEGGFAALGNQGIVELFLVAEDQIADVCRASLGDLITDEEWDAMAWEELPVIAQALWTLNVARPDGGGLLGKLGAGLGKALAGTLVTGRQAASKGNGKTETQSIPMDLNKTPSKPMDSAISVDGGTAIPS